MSVVALALHSIDPGEFLQRGGGGGGGRDKAVGEGGGEFEGVPRGSNKTTYSGWKEESSKGEEGTERGSPSYSIPWRRNWEEEDGGKKQTRRGTSPQI